MKKWIFLLSIPLAILTFGSCKKLRNLLTFNINYPDTEEVPANPLIGLPLSFVSGNIATNSSTEFKNNNTATSLIKHVYLKTLTLNILAPQGQDFSFVKSVSLSLYTPSLGTTEIAFLDTIPPSPGTQLTLTATGNDIQNYIKVDSFAIETNVVAKKTTSQPITISINSNFQVTASPF
jgi:hypothetical protein